MARRRKMDPERKAFINSLLEHYKPKDAQDVQEMLKDLLGESEPQIVKKNQTDISNIEDQFLSMDAMQFNVREDNRTVKKAVYVAIGVKLNGLREVLGMWIGGNESTKYLLGVLNEIKNRGVEDIMIVSVDGLTGFGDVSI